MGISLEKTTRATDEARALISELEAELSVGFEPHQQHGLSVDKVFQANIAFFIARLDGVAVGCGGVAFDDGFAEIKRMYVRKSVRGRGVAQALLVRLEEEARAKDYRLLALETGDTLEPAQRLYEAFGFKRCDPFGHYRAMAPAAIERSHFFEKRLT